MSDSATKHHAKVRALATMAQDLILRGLEDDELTGATRWLLYGRVVALLYGSHFAISARIGNDALDRAEESAQAAKDTGAPESTG